MQPFSRRNRPRAGQPALSLITSPFVLRIEQILRWYSIVNAPFPRAPIRVHLSVAHSLAHIVIANIIAAARGIEASQVLREESESAPEVRLLVWKTYWKLMSELLEQLSGVTSGTSSGSAKVISTHCNRPRISKIFRKSVARPGKEIANSRCKAPRHAALSQ